MIRFIIPGDPVPWARARRNGKRYYTDPDVTAHAKAIRQAWMAAGRPRIGETAAVSMLVQCFLERPAGHYRTGRNRHLVRDSAPEWPIGKPDADNLGKIVCDALNGLMYRDDAQVATLTVSKYFADVDEQPRTVLKAWVPTPRIRI